MPLKFIRLGYTESTLLLLYFYRTNTEIYNNSMINLEKSLIKWLYTTSGFYDKNAHSYSYMNVEYNVINSRTYKTYMNNLLDVIKNSNKLNLCFHKHFDNSSILIEKFINNFNVKNDYLHCQDVFDFIKSKKILVISPFAVLIKNQIENGNCEKIYHNFPKIECVLTYTYPYTFLNNGPDNNIIETCENNFANIIETIKNDYDTVLIGCGAYSCLLAEKFFTLGKNVCTLGSDMQTFFGILNARHKDYLEKNLSNENLEYWITEIPDCYKPDCYKMIEDGCYW
jgi:hypothetical protein